MMVLATLIETAAFSVLKQYGWLFAGAVLTTASYSAAQIAYYTAFAQRFRGGELALVFALDYGTHRFAHACLYNY